LPASSTTAVYAWLRNPQGLGLACGNPQRCPPLLERSAQRRTRPYFDVTSRKKSGARGRPPGASWQTWRLQGCLGWRGRTAEGQKQDHPSLHSWVRWQSSRAGSTQDQRAALSGPQRGRRAEAVASTCRCAVGCDVGFGAPFTALGIMGCWLRDRRGLDRAAMGIRFLRHMTSPAVPRRVVVAGRLILAAVRGRRCWAGLLLRSGLDAVLRFCPRTNLTATAVLSPGS